MNEMFALLLAWMAGAMLGVVFFGGLWWTIRKAVLSQRPALWFFGSALLRVTVALGGFYFFASGRWETFLLCVAGFVMARLAVTWMTRQPGEYLSPKASEGCHAP
jgi:F1F0 ATPase subunit 2